MIEIPLTKGYVAIVDDEDAHLAAHKWFAHVGSTGVIYARRWDGVDERGHQVPVWLHRAVLGVARGSGLVDHRDGDGLNCRRANLRQASKSENGRNRAGARRDNRSCGVLGVTRRADGKCVATIGVDGVKKYLGIFASVEEARDARRRAEITEWGVQPRRITEHRASA